MARVSDDPVALRSPAMCGFFAGVMRRQMRRGFRAVRLARPGLPALPEGAPLIVYANHPSWWDPAFLMVLAVSLFPNRESYGPMEAAALERYGFMKRIGLFGVAPGTLAGAARFLRVGERVLADPGRMIWMTAQGEFADARARPVRLRPGLAHLLARVPGAVAVPLALEYPFWTEKRPEALAAFGRPIAADGDAAALQDRVTQALEAAQDALAALALARDAAAFRPILDGRSGVGGIYGGWSRMKSLARGAQYQSDHLPDRAR